MLSRPSHRARPLVLALLALLAAVPPARAQIGPVFTGAGPTNISMGGTSVAAPLDATGALYWNPATMSGLPGSSVDFGLSLVHPQTRLASGIVGLGAGSDRGDDGIFPLPSMALVYRPDDSRLTLGLGVFVASGFGVNYPASTTNPILTPQPPNGVGFGPLFSNFSVIQLAPAASYQLTDRLAVSAGPILDLATLRADPLFLAAPNANGAYSQGTHTRTTWGAGAQAGVYYTLDGGWRLGASIKSPQWFEDFRFQSADAKGLPRTANSRFDFPMIPSVGVGYAGFDRWLLAADFRYVDFANADGFRQSGFAPNGSIQGLGWRGVFAMSLGAQYQLHENLALRLGYSYNQNPIPDAQSSFNIASPTIVEHNIYVGASYRVSDALSLSLAYTHGFENTIEGPLVAPAGAVPGSFVRNSTSVDSFLLGVTVRFGARAATTTVCNETVPTSYQP